MNATIREFRRPALRLACLLCLTALAGCSSFVHKSTEEVAGAPEPPKYITIVGIGTGMGTPAAVPLPGFNGQIAGTMRADASAPLDAQVADPATRSLMARAEARRKALRALVASVLGQRDAQGTSLGDSLKQHPTDQSKLNALLEEKAQVTFTQEGQGVHASASLDGKLINDTLGLGGARTATPMPADARKEAAFTQAVEDAKQKLEQALKEIKLDDGRTVKQALEDNPDAAVDFKALLWVTQPDVTQYNPDGSCEVKIIFDQNRVTEMFKTTKAWWQFWK